MNDAYSDEFIGQEIKVIKSRNKSTEGLSGKIIDETKYSLLILDTKNREKRLLKKGSVFMIGGKEIIGDKITFRAEERIKLKK